MIESGCVYQVEMVVLFFFLFFLFFLENAGIERLMNSVWKKFRGPSDAVTYHSLDL